MNKAHCLLDATFVSNINNKQLQAYTICSANARLVAVSIAYTKMKDDAASLQFESKQANIYIWFSGK